MEKNNNLQKKTILYIVHDYNNFQKDPIEEISKSFRKVYVLVRYKPLSWFAKYLPIKSLRRYEDSKVLDMKDVPSNVTVIRTPVWYLPFGFFYKIAGYLHYLSAQRAIKKHKIKFDLIHAHFIWSAGYVGMRLKDKYDVPFVVTGHGFDVYQLPFESNFWMKRTVEILSSADKVISVSKSNINIIKEFVSEKSKINLIYNSFNHNLFFEKLKTDSRKKIDMDMSKRVILSIGNFEKVKGHEYLIEAIAILNKRYSDLLCYIVGGGSRYAYLKEKIESYGLEEKIILVDAVPHKSVNDWINACDIFVLPSLSESFGIVQIEAFACGKPVVASKNEGSKEVIISEEYGYLCNIADPIDLANNIDKALKKDWDKEKIIEYSVKFKQETINKELVNLYNQLLTEK